MRGYADTRFGQLHYVRQGKGDTVVLLHAAGRSSRVFLGTTGLLTILSDRFDVIAFDVFGSGNSDPLPQNATYNDLAAAIIEAFDQLGVEKASVYGLHTGNKIGSALAADFPERIRHLILCGQSHSLIRSQDARNEAMRTIAGRVRTTHGDWMEPDRIGLIEWSMLSQRVLTTWWNPKYFERLSVPDALDAVQRAVLDDIQSDRSLPELYAMNFAYDMDADWARITVPTLIIEVVHPLEEAIYGHRGEEAKAAISGAELVQITAGGYKMTLEERSKELADFIVDFVTRTA